MFYGGVFWISCIVFTVDILLPAGVSVGLCYAGVVLLGKLSPTPRYYIVTAITGTLLTVLGFLVSPQIGEVWVAVTNRVLTVSIIWTIAFLCWRRMKEHGKE